MVQVDHAPRARAAACPAGRRAHHAVSADADRLPRRSLRPASCMPRRASPGNGAARCRHRRHHIPHSGQPEGTRTHRMCAHGTRARARTQSSLAEVAALWSRYEAAVAAQLLEAETSSLPLMRAYFGPADVARLNARILDASSALELGGGRPPACLGMRFGHVRRDIELRCGPPPFSSPSNL